MDQDAELIRHIRQGNSRELEILVERHILPLVKFFQYLDVPPALIDDLVQETFIRACDNLGSFDLKRRFTPWLFAIGKNLFLDQRRKNHRRSAFSETPGLVPDIADHIVADHEVSRILQALPAKERFLLELRIFQELSYTEIAELTNETTENLRARFSRMMKRLREAMESKESA